MALQITNIDDLKSSQACILEAKTSYDEILAKLRNAIVDTENYWNDMDSYKYREKLLDLIDSKLTEVSTEMEFESSFLKKTYLTLEDAKTQVKNRLNGE